MACALWTCGKCACQRLTDARSLIKATNTTVTVVRGKKQWLRKFYGALYKRRLAQGPEPVKHRSELLNWNFQSEIYAFGKRLGEEFNEATLKRAFTHGSYIENEEKLRSGLGMTFESATLDLEDNKQLTEQGRALSDKYIKAYIRNSLPNLPEEGVSAITDHLMSEDMLSYVGSNLGLTDLILCKEFPPQKSTIADTFLAVIGGIQQDQGTKQAQLFVQDFVLTMLVGKDVHTLWEIHNPMGLLKDILSSLDKGPPESRLMWETGSETIMAAYMVGIYSDRHLIGKSAGETVTIAEEMAARDALREIFGLSKSSLPFKFGEKGHKLELDMQRLNKSVVDFKPS